MQLAYVICDRRGGTDLLLTELSGLLAGRGIRMAGVVQINTECADNAKCDMDLKVLPDGDTIRISQSLGAGARGCRLNAAELERAVALVGASLETDDPQVLIINKFGKHEADGRGFRPLIGEALSRGIPVLAGVNALNEDKFQEFAGGMGERIADDKEALAAWVVAATGSDVSDVA